EDTEKPPKPRRLTSNSALTLQTLTGLSSTQAIALHAGGTGLAITGGVAAGTAAAGYAVHKFSPGLAERLRLRKPTPHRKAQSNRARHKTNSHSRRPGATNRT